MKKGLALLLIISLISLVSAGSQRDDFETCFMDSRRTLDLDGNEETQLIRGDTDGDGRITLTDAVAILNWLFRGGDQPLCAAMADTDGDGRYTLSDAVRILRYLFSGGPPPVDIELEDFDLNPMLIPISPIQNDIVTISFSSVEDGNIIYFYPVNIFDTTICNARAISLEGEEIDLFEVELEEEDHLYLLNPLELILHPDDPLAMGEYTIRAECRSSNGRFGEAEVTLILEREEPPEAPAACPVDSAICCRKDFEEIEETSYYCVPVNEFDPNHDKLFELSCEEDEFRVDNSFCEPQEEGAGGELLSDSNINEDKKIEFLQSPGESPGDDPEYSETPGKCRVKCLTILRNGLGGECKSVPISFPAAQFKADGKGELGPDYAPHMGPLSPEQDRGWESGTVGVGPNKGYATSFREGLGGYEADPTLKPEMEGIEVVGYGFITGATYIGITEENGEIRETQNVDPKKCREYQFIYSTLKFSREGRADELFYAFTNSKRLTEVSGESSSSLLDLDNRGRLSSNKEIADMIKRVGNTHISSGKCGIAGNQICDDDYFYSKRTGDYTEYREFNTNEYNPITHKEEKFFGKAFELTGESKKMFYFDNPLLIQSADKRIYQISKKTKTIEREDRFVAIAEDETGDHKIECELRGLKLSVTPENAVYSRKTITPPTFCECKEYTRMADGGWVNEAPRNQDGTRDDPIWFC